MTREEFKKLAREEAQKWRYPANPYDSFKAGCEFGFDWGAKSEREFLLNLIRYEVGKDALDIIEAILAEREGTGKEVCYQRIENNDRNNCYSRSNEDCEIAGDKCIHCGQLASKNKLAERKSGGAKSES